MPPRVIRLDAHGPFGWPRLEGKIPALPAIPGVYLMTVQHKDGYLPYGVGITRRAIRKRFLEHTRSYIKGEYNVLAIESAQRGKREVVWKGWGWTPEKRADFDSRRESIEDSARAQMSATRIFVIETGTEERLLERLEAAIANHYYEKEDILFDRGMLRMPRWKSEQPLIAEIVCASKIVGLSARLEI